MRYFVSWVTKNYGFGNDIIEVNKPLNDYDELLKAEHQIRYKEKFPEIPVILYYKRVYDE